MIDLEVTEERLRKKISLDCSSSINWVRGKVSGRSAEMAGNSIY